MIVRARLEHPEDAERRLTIFLRGPEDVEALEAAEGRGFVVTEFVPVDGPPAT